MKKKNAPAADKSAMQSEKQNEVQDDAHKAQAKDCSAKRRKYSINDVLRIMKALDEAKMEMERKKRSCSDAEPVFKISLLYKNNVDRLK
ncbi:MAG: hypothetical protein Q3990_09295 [Desulfovibrionaceae bacterium]|nr:hypothetical protein [Desulfovibrionaceae bacterium]